MAIALLYRFLATTGDMQARDEGGRARWCRCFRRIVALLERGSDGVDNVLGLGRVRQVYVFGCAANSAAFVSTRGGYRRAVGESSAFEQGEKGVLMC